MRRRSATTRLIVDALRVLREMVGVLSKPESGSDMRTAGTTTNIVALWRTRSARSRSELGSFPSGLAPNTKSSMMYSGQGQLHTMLRMYLKGLSHTHPSLRPKRHRTPDGWACEGRSGRCVRCEGLSVHNLPVKGQQNSGTFQTPWAIACWMW